MLVLAVLLGLTLSPSAAQESTPDVESSGPACASGLSESSGAAPSDDNDGDDDLAEWQTLEMIDARTGETFRVSDFLGCTVLVETMATWCINCLMQLGYLSEALPELDPDSFVAIAISVETDLSAEDLAAYADNSEFDWLFSVASPEMLRAIVDAFGREAIVPPSTPHVIVQPDGTPGELQTGFRTPEELIDDLTEASESLP